MMRRLAFITVLLAGLLSSASATAQPACWTIENAVVWSPERLLPEGPGPTSLHVRGNLIESVGERSEVSKDCEVIDAQGCYVTAGLIEPFTQLGMVEVGIEASTVDSKVVEKPKGTEIRASYRAADVYNPLSSAVRVSRSHGVTSAVIVPDGGLISGRAGWVDLVGVHQRDAVRRDAVALVARYGSRQGSRLELLHHLGALFEAAASYDAGATHGAAEVLRWEYPERDLIVVRDAQKRRVPVVFRVDRAADIEAVLRLAEAHDLRVVIAGGAEAWIVAEQLAKRSVPVIVDGLLSAPESFDALHARADNAARLADAGVEVLLSTNSTHNVRTLRQVAGNAVRAGLPWHKALEAITAAPARVFMEGQGGVLAPNQPATVVLWSGDPFELSTRAARVWIRGQAISLSNRQTRLLQRYRQDPRGRPPAL